MKILRQQISGFTLIEILVAMVVLAVGLLGMSAMTILVMKGSRGASDLTAATNICQLKMEELKDVNWDQLGGNSTSDPVADRITYGLANAQMVQQPSLNSQGKDWATVGNEQAPPTTNPDDPAVRALGPYKYNRTYVICKGSDYSGPAQSPTPPDTLPSGSAAAYATPLPGEPLRAIDCRATPDDYLSRVEALACLSSDITGVPGCPTPTDLSSCNKEKKIKILCTWQDRSGDCHSVHMDTTVVKLGS